MKTEKDPISQAPQPEKLTPGRRTFLKGGLAAAAALAVPWKGLAAPASSGAARASVEGIIDTNVHLSRWPYRRLKEDETPALVAKMQKYGVGEAWASSFDVLLHKDVAAVNVNLAEECRKHGKGILRPFGALNLNLPGWEEDLRRCDEVHRMPGVRLYPGHHGYTLADPVFGRFADLASRRGLLIQIVGIIEDSRTQHISAVAPEVDPSPLLDLLPKLPRARVQLLSSTNRMLGRVSSGVGERISYDISRVHGLGHIGELMRTISPNRILFGSLAPFFYYEAALMKVVASKLDEAQTGLILQENARRLISKA